MIKPLLLLLAGAVLLAGCAARPLPPELYYRLDATPPQTPVHERAPKVLVEGFDAHGLYAERAMIFSRPEAQGALEQYRHQYWVESPALMLGDGLRATLRRALGDGKVQPRNARERADWVISPRLRRLQQVIDASGSSAAEYAIDVLVTDESNRPRFTFSFEERLAAQNATPAAYAAAASTLAAKANLAFLERLSREF